MRPGQRPFLARMRALANGWPATAPEAVGQATSSSGCKLLIPSTPTSDFRTGWWQADWRGGVVRPVRYLGRARRLPFRGGPRHVAAIPGQQDDATWPAEHCMASQWQCPVVYRWSGLPPRHHPETFQVGLSSIDECAGLSAAQVPFVPNYWRLRRPDDLGSSPARFAVAHASDGRTVRLHLVSARSCEAAITR